jgi:hypothetical protein
MTGPLEKPDLLAAKTPEAAGEQIRKFFSHVRSKGLPALVKDTDTTLALQASWLLALGPGNEAVPPRPKEFVRFFEARTGLKVPLRWEYNLVMTGLAYSPDSSRLRAAAQKEYLPSCPFLEETEPGKGNIEYHYQEFATASGGVRAPVGTFIERKNGKILIQVENAKVEVREADLPEGALMHAYVPGAHIGPVRSFLALHYDFLPTLLCIDSHSGEVLWQRPLWTTYCKGLYSVVPPEELTFLTNENHVVVFGVGHSAYVEAFDLKSGNPVFGFSSDHWFFTDWDELSSWRRSLWRQWW